MTIHIEDGYIIGDDDAVSENESLTIDGVVFEVFSDGIAVSAAESWPGIDLVITVCHDRFFVGSWEKQSNNVSSRFKIDYGPFDTISEAKAVLAILEAAS